MEKPLQIAETLTESPKFQLHRETTVAGISSDLSITQTWLHCNGDLILNFSIQTENDDRYKSRIPFEFSTIFTARSGAETLEEFLVNVFWTGCRLPISDIPAKDRSPLVVKSLGPNINSKEARSLPEPTHFRLNFRTRPSGEL